MRWATSTPRAARNLSASVKARSGRFPTRSQPLGIDPADGSVSSKTKGIASPTDTDTDTAYTGIATCKYHVLGNKHIQETQWFWTVDRYYYWFNDAAGSSHAKIDGTAKLTQDVTYYLKWDSDPAIEHVEGDTTIPSDMWSGSQDKTTSIKEVSTGETFSMTYVAFKPWITLKIKSPAVAP